MTTKGTQPCNVSRSIKPPNASVAQCKCLKCFTVIRNRLMQVHSAFKCFPVIRYRLVLEVFNCVLVNPNCLMQVRSASKCVPVIGTAWCKCTQRLNVSRSIRTAWCKCLKRLSVSQWFGTVWCKSYERLNVSWSVGTPWCTCLRCQNLATMNPPAVQNRSNTTNDVYRAGLPDRTRRYREYQNRSLCGRFVTQYRQWSLFSRNIGLNIPEITYIYYQEYRRTGYYWISLTLNHHNLIFNLAIGR